jgi:hypothetical protein
MINCPYVVIDEVAFFAQIAGAKQKKFRDVLDPIQPRVATAYQHYLHDFPTLLAQNNSEFTEEEDIREALLKCYSVNTQPWLTFKKSYLAGLPEGLKLFCPYCMMDRPRTWDHYVGKEEFPEFAVLTKNVIRTCWHCNHKKRENWRAAGRRIFINYYDDHILDLPFLTADLAVEPGGSIPAIHFELVQPEGMSDDDFALVDSHFNALGLLPDYEGRANSLLSSEISVIDHFLRAGLTRELMLNIIVVKANDAVAKFGTNYWETVLYRTMAAQIDLILGLI